MKVRTDFVTNSSSSSFIVSFNDEDDLIGSINSCVEEGLNQEDFYTRYLDEHYDIDQLKDELFDRIYSGIINNKSSAEDAINEYRDNSYIIFDLIHEYNDQWNEMTSYEWGKFISPKLDERLSKEIENIISNLKENISLVDYGDDNAVDGFIENDLMPNFKYTVKRISHH